MEFVVLHLIGLEVIWTTDYNVARYNSVCTGKSHIFCGVPQRSILAPLLFLIYINDICCASNIFHFILFANDTNLFLSHKNLQYLTDQANHELIKLSLWPTANKLWINLKKNNFMILTKTKKSVPSFLKFFQMIMKSILLTIPVFLVLF